MPDICYARSSSLFALARRRSSARRQSRSSRSKLSASRGCALLPIREGREGREGRAGSRYPREARRGRGEERTTRYGRGRAERWKLVRSAAAAREFHRGLRYLVLADAYVVNAAGEDDLAANRGGLIANRRHENRTGRPSARQI